MNKTKIEWADHSWNPVSGCTKVSPGCKNCYAERMAKRLAGRFGYPADEPFRVTLHKDRLKDPLHWKKPRRIFVCSMGDLFHKDVPRDYIEQIFEVMEMCPQHTFIILTKRPEWIIPTIYSSDLNDYCGHYGGGDYNSNIWLLTSVENQATADWRIPQLLKLKEECPAWTVGVSIEPMLGEVDLMKPVIVKKYIKNSMQEVHSTYIKELDWVILGCESGSGARPMLPVWVRVIKHQCIWAKVPFFFKQSPGPEGIVKLPVLDGRIYREYPDGQ